MHTSDRHLTVLLGPVESKVASLFASLLRPRPELKLISHDGPALALVEAAASGRFDAVVIGPGEGAMDGLLIADELRRRDQQGLSPALVVLAGYDPELACRAFDVGATDFLPRPVARGRVERCVERLTRLADLRKDAKCATGSQPVLLRPSEEERAELIWVESGGERVSIDPERIEWASADGRRCRLQCGTEILRYTASLSSLAERLDPDRFLRIHMSHIVNERAVARLRRASSGSLEVVTRDGTVLSVSRSCQPVLRGFRDKVRSAIR